MLRSKKHIKFTSFTMLFVLLFSTVGITADYHYCQGEVKNVSLIGEAKPCDKEHKEHTQESKVIRACCAPVEIKGNKITDFNLDLLPTISDHKACCNNELKFHQLDIETKIAAVDGINIDILQDFVIYNGFETHSINLYHFTSLLPEKYIPPPLKRSIIVLFQSFLL